MTGSESIDQKLARLGPMFSIRPWIHRHQQDTRRRQGHPAGQRQQSYSGVAVSDLKGFNEKYGLNSRLVKQNGKLVEEIYRVDGRYGITESSSTWRRRRRSPNRRPRGDALSFYRTGEVADREV
jgi:hypothetical protein